MIFPIDEESYVFLESLERDIRKYVTDVELEPLKKKCKELDEQFKSYSEILDDIHRHAGDQLLEICSYCNLYIPTTIGNDYEFKCESEHHNCGKVWCGRDFCKSTMLTCSDCDYGMCSEHVVVCQECNKKICIQCSQTHSGTRYCTV